MNLAWSTWESILEWFWEWCLLSIDSIRELIWNLAPELYSYYNTWSDFNSFSHLTFILAKPVQEPVMLSISYSVLTTWASLKYMSLIYLAFASDGRPSISTVKYCTFYSVSGAYLSKFEGLFLFEISYGYEFRHFCAYWFYFNYWPNISLDLLNS